MLKFKFSAALAAVALCLTARDAVAACAPALDDALANVTVTRTRGRDGRVMFVKFTDLTRTELTATAALVGDEVQFDLRLDNPSGRPRALFGRDVVRVALDEFDGRVRVVRGVWLAGVNLDVFYALTAAGVADDAAAAATWTGRVAHRHGFTRPRQLYPNGDARIPRYVRYNFERP